MSPCPSELPAVSLFSNCGAGDLGFAHAGFRFEVLAELRRMRLDVAELNHPQAAGVQGDLRDTWREVVAEYRRRQPARRPALLAACPPCQGMSSARGGRGKGHDADAGSRDERNLLVEVIARVAERLEPDLVVVENVSAFLTRRVRHPDDRLPVSAAVLLRRRLHEHYRAFPMLTDLADFGVPQQRRRAFVTFVRRDLPGLATLDEHGLTPLPAPGSSRTTVRAALASLGAGPLDAAAVETAGRGMHAVPVWKARQYAMVAAIPPDTGGGAWANDACPECGAVDVGPEDAACPRCSGPLARPVVATDDGGWRLVRGFRASSYTRMRADEPASTVTTASGHVGSDKTIHPWEHRVLSPLECQHIQTFPEDFRWGDALKRWGHTNVREMIGEAVPPQFTALHGDVLAAIVHGNRPSGAAPAAERRLQRARRVLDRAEDDYRAAQDRLGADPA